MKLRLLIALCVGLFCYSCTGKPEKMYNSLDDLQQSTIGVLLGSSQDAYITKHFPQANVLRIDMAPDLAVALNAGTCDAAVFDAIMTTQFMKEYPNFGILEENLMETPLGVGFNKENRELCDKFNLFLERIRKDGTYDQIEKRWVFTVDESSEMPELVLPKSGKPLLVGTTGAYFPYSFVKNGHPAGFDVEIATRFAIEIDRPIKFEIMNFGGLIPALASKKLDVIINSIMITPERQKEVAFSEPYVLSIAKVVTLKKNLPVATGYKSIDDLKEKRFAVMMGSTHDAYLTKQFPEAEILRLENEADVMLAVQGERADAGLLDNLTYRNLEKEYSNTSMLVEGVFNEEMGIGFGQTQLTLRDQFNVFLKQLRTSGLYDQILRRWTDSSATAQLPVFSIPEDGDVIKAAITGIMPPFSFVKEGKNVGFDVEILSRFAEYVKRPITFDHISFGGLIAALSSGKVDIISAGITITPERAKTVAFSDTYYESKSTLMVLTKNIAGAPVGDVAADKKSLITRIGDSFYNNIVAEKRYLLIISGLGITILISVMAALLGTLFGAGICYLRMSKQKTMCLIGKAYINLMRGIPILVLLMLMYYVVFASWDLDATVVAIIAFALNFAAYVSEMFRSSIEGVDKGQSEAGIALGFTKVQTFLYIIMPQAVKSVLPVYKGELISLIKMTSIVGYVAVSDLTKASDIIRSRTFDAFFPLIMVAVLYFILAWIFAAALDYFNNTKLSRK